MKPKSKTKTNRLLVYLKGRSIYEDKGFDLNPRILEAFFSSGIREFAGVKVDDTGNLICDKTNPEFFKEWNSK